MTKLLNDVLDRIDEYLQDREDVRDGADGPRPNEAMHLLTELRYARSHQPEGEVGIPLALAKELANGHDSLAVFELRGLLDRVKT